MNQPSDNADSENKPELQLIDGESRQVKSAYYQRLIQYTRSLIRCLNGTKITPDLEAYCHKQLWLTRIEMDDIREKYFQITNVEPPNGDGPKAS